MRDDEDRALFLAVEIAEERAYRLGRLRVEVARRLVRENDVGRRDERAGDCDALALAARKFLGLLRKDVGNAKRRDERRKPPFVDLRPVEAKRKDDILSHRLLVKEVERLEDDSDVAAAELRRGRVAHLHDVASSDENLARVGGKKPGCKMQERRLAAAARAH